jgi:ABC-2 type transport system permease protein
LLVGVPLYGVDMSNPDVLATVVIFLLTVFSFAGIGMMWASLIMFVKRGEGIATMFGYGLILVSGVLVPVATLPPAIQAIAAFVPLTHALDGMRYALLQGAGLWDPNVRQSVLELLGFSVVLLTLGIGAFTLSVHHAKRNGTLTEY